MSNFTSVLAQLTEARPKDTTMPKLPAKFSTLKAKIISKNPWSRGEDIAAAFEKEYPKILELSKGTSKSEFLKQVCDLPAIAALATKLHLSDRHMVTGIITL